MMNQGSRKKQEQDSPPLGQRGFMLVGGSIVPMADGYAEKEICSPLSCRIRGHFRPEVGTPKLPPGCLRAPLYGAPTSAAPFTYSMLQWYRGSERPKSVAYGRPYVTLRGKIMSTDSIQWIEEHGTTALAAKEAIKLRVKACERSTDEALTATLADYYNNLKGESHDQKQEKNRHKTAGRRSREYDGSTEREQREVSLF
jgi:hypothetical protein